MNGRYAGTNYASAWSGPAKRKAVKEHPRGDENEQRTVEEHEKEAIQDASCRSQPVTRVGGAILRVTVGTIFLAHGAQKLFDEGFGGVAGMMERFGVPAPALAAVAFVLVELVGGAALILGLFRAGANRPGEASLDRFLAWRGVLLRGERSLTETSARETTTRGGLDWLPHRLGSRKEEQSYPYSRGR